MVLRGQAELIEPGQPRQEEMRRRIIHKYHSSVAAADAYYASVRGNPGVLIVVHPRGLVS